MTKRKQNDSMTSMDKDRDGKEYLLSKVAERRWLVKAFAELIKKQSLSRDDEKADYFTIGVIGFSRYREAV